MPRALEARLATPSGPPRAGALVCHPHPLYGGDMDNGVVVTAARSLVGAGLAAMRFNFGGIGRSGGTAGAGEAEVADVHAALAALAARLPASTPLVLAGYSFGGWAALRAAAEGARVAQVLMIAPPIDVIAFGFLAEVEVPVAVLVGDRDQYCPVAALERLVTGRPRVSVRTIAGADHFLAGNEGDVAALVPDLLVF